MVKKFLLTALLVVGLAGLAFAAAEWQQNGTRINKSEAVNFKNGPTVTGNGTVTDVDFGTMTGAQTIVGAVDITGATEINGILTTDGTIYTAKIMSDGAIYGGRASSDPCGTLGAGFIFFNDSTGVPCYCSNTGVDLAIYSATTACF